MKLKLIITSVLIHISMFINAQNTYIQNIAKIATVNFPTKPTCITYVYGSEYYLDTKEYSRFLFSNVDLDSSLNTPTLEDLNIVYTGFTDGVLNKYKGTLISQKKILLGKLIGIKLEVSSLINSGISYNVYIRAFLINKTIFSCQYACITTMQSQLKKEREDFLNSFKLITPENSIIQYKN